MPHPDDVKIGTWIAIAVVWVIAVAFAVCSWAALHRLLHWFEDSC